MAGQRLAVPDRVVRLRDDQGAVAAGDDETVHRGEPEGSEIAEAREMAGQRPDHGVRSPAPRDHRVAPVQQVQVLATAGRVVLGKRECEERRDRGLGHR